jgi:RNA polymerase sigma factor (sigma-70 family)
MYIRSTARRALMRLCDQRRGLVSLDEAAEREDPMSGSGRAPRAPSAPPERSAEAQEFVRGLVECLSRLRERARTVWILRGIHELSTREIASHPKIDVSPGNVDVILMRVRESLRDCLGSKGLEPGHLPPGSFTHFWLAMSGLAVNPQEVVEERRW